MAAQKTVKWVVTGNTTKDAVVVYVRADKTLARVVDEAACFDDKDAAEALRKAALTLEHEISDPYLMEVAETPQGLDLLTARERIRAQGPTVRVRRPDPVAH
jgi:hypothetical protein